MKKSRYSDSQILTILNQAEAGTPVSALCREHGMSSAAFYKWRAIFFDVPHNQSIIITRPLIG
jgi:putative transposase